MQVPYWKYLRASLTLGFQHRAGMNQAGPRVKHYRLSMGNSSAAFFEEVQGDLRLIPDYLEPRKLVDTTEKTVLSYWQGMVFAKLAADQALGIRWLAHADTLEEAGMLSRKGNKEHRADFAGLDLQQRWHVIEAKGYTSAYSQEQLRAAKEDQAGCVSRINQQPPTTTSACITSLWKAPIEILLDDPPPPGKQHWRISLADFYHHYYAGVIHYIQQWHSIKRPPDDAEKLSIQRFMPQTKSGDKTQPYDQFQFAPIHLPAAFPHDGQPLIDTQTVWIGLPTALMEAPTQAPEILSQLFPEGRPDQMASDGIALLGHLPDWPASAAHPRDLKPNFDE